MKRKPANNAVLSYPYPPSSLTVHYCTAFTASELCLLRLSMTAAPRPF